MRCPHCQTPLVADARFCPACGTATAPTDASPSAPAAGGAPDLVGKEIAGRYRILAKLGEGGMGAVYRGEQISLKRSVAVKLLRPELGSHQTILRRFNAEAEAVAKLNHPNTVNIYDFGQDSDGSLFIAMEFIEGRSLREAIQKGGPLGLRRALSIAQQIAASLSDAHEHSIVHRDLKPDNVMLQDRGKQKDVVRVLDFGIAKLRDDSRATQGAMTQAGDMLGTPQYMAPEQIKGEAIDGRTDIYALGCMIYEMVTGRMPYEAPTIMAMLSKHLMENPVPPSQRRPDLGLPPAIDHLVATAMAKDPAMRPATMEQFGEMIGGLLSTLPADPNRSGGMSMQHGAGGAAVTPPALSAFGPPGTAPPPFGTPIGFGSAAPGFAAPTPQHGGMFAAPGALPVPGGFAPAPVPFAPEPTSNSRGPLIAILAVLGLAGVGLAVWALALRDDDKPAASAGSAGATGDDPWGTTTPEPAKTDTEDRDEDVPAAQPAQPADDPWADRDAPGGAALGAPAPKTDAPKGLMKAAALGTAELPIPAGARLVPPSGFSKLSETPTAVLYANPKRNLVIGMASLYPGTNDPQEIAKLWSRDTGAELMHSDTTFSHGAQRPVLAFTADASGVKVVQIAALYISSSYRLAVLYQAPLELLVDEAFQAEVEKFFDKNVKLP